MPAAFVTWTRVHPASRSHSAYCSTPARSAITTRSPGREKLFSDTDRDTQRLKLVDSEVFSNGIQKNIFDVIH